MGFSTRLTSTRTRTRPNLTYLTTLINTRALLQLKTHWIHITSLCSSSLILPLIFRAIVTLRVPSFHPWVHGFRNLLCKPWGAVSWVGLHLGQAEITFEAVAHYITCSLFLSSFLAIDFYYPPNNVLPILLFQIQNSILEIIYIYSYAFDHNLIDWHSNKLPIEDSLTANKLHMIV